MVKIASFKYFCTKLGVEVCLRRVSWGGGVCRALQTLIQAIYN